MLPPVMTCISRSNMTCTRPRFGGLQSRWMIAKGLILLLWFASCCSSADAAEKPAADQRSKGSLFGDHAFDVKYSTLAGVVKRSATKLFITPEKVKAITDALAQTVHWEELLVIFTLGWLTVPALQGPVESMQSFTSRGRRRRAKTFEDTYFHLILDHISQLAKLAFVVYMVDILKVVAIGLGFSFQGMEVNHAFAKVLYTAWLSNRFANLKRFVLAKQTDQDHRDLDGEVQIVDRLIDALIYGLGLYVIVDTLQTDIGAATKSFLALGSVSTLVVSLAMQGFVAQVLHGLFLAGSNRVAEGDSVEIGNVRGKLVSLGWLESSIRRSDDVLITIPNKDLADQRISNLSRVMQSQVKQVLRFKNHEEADELVPELIEDMKKEIGLACPTLITDGTRPFRIHMSSFEPGYLQVTCDLHFRIRPVGDNYHDNRQECLWAIARAVKRSKLEFA